MNRPLRASRSLAIGGARTPLLISAVIACITVASEPGHGEEAAADKTVLSLDNVSINKVTKEVRLKTRLALIEGILEYFLVGDGGKTYESVFKIGKNRPSDLNFALLLVGCKPLKFDAFAKLAGDEDGLNKLLADHPESVVEMEVQRDGKTVDLFEIIRNREGSKQQLIWVYTGGYFLSDNRYVGNMELSHIGVFPDPSAVINLFSREGNPYQGNFGFAMNTENKEIEVEQEYELVLRRRK